MKRSQVKNVTGQIGDGLCIEENTKFAGFGIRDNRIDEIFSPEECRSKCQSREDCQFWTWNSEAFPVLPNTCWLKSSAAGR